MELPPLEPGTGQVRIAVQAAAVGLPDVFMCRGTYPLTPAGRFVPGQEVAGTVRAGRTRPSVAVGTRVMAITDFVHGHGGFADETLADAANVYEAPAGMTDTHTGGLRHRVPTAWIGLVHRASVRAGDTVVVLGATGGTGSAAVRSHALGATVIGVVGDDDKARVCVESGADAVIDRSRERVSEGVRRLTGGCGADVVYDTVGGAVANDAMRAVADCGRFLLVGSASGAWPDVDTARLVTGNFSVLGVYTGAGTRAEHEQMIEQLTALVADGTLRPQVDATLR